MGGEAETRTKRCEVMRDVKVKKKRATIRRTRNKLSPNRSQRRKKKNTDPGSFLGGLKTTKKNTEKRGSVRREHGKERQKNGCPGFRKKMARTKKNARNFLSDHLGDWKKKDAGGNKRAKMLKMRGSVLGTVKKRR